LEIDNGVAIAGEVSVRATHLVRLIWTWYDLFHRERCPNVL